METTATSSAPHDFQRQPNARRPQGSVGGREGSAWLLMQSAVEIGAMLPFRRRYIYVCAVKIHVKGNQAEGQTILLQPAAAPRLQQNCWMNMRATRGRARHTGCDAISRQGLCHIHEEIVAVGWVRYRADAKRWRETRPMISSNQDLGGPWSVVAVGVGGAAGVIARCAHEVHAVDALKATGPGGGMTNGKGKRGLKQGRGGTWTQHCSKLW
jgi:hypothetical protein